MLQMVEPLIIVLTLIIAFLVVVILWFSGTAIYIMKVPKNNPKNYLKKLDRSSGEHARKVIVFVGDSITHGTFNENYTKLVKNRLDDKSFEYIISLWFYNTCLYKIFNIFLKVVVCYLSLRPPSSGIFEPIR